MVFGNYLKTMFIRQQKSTPIKSKQITGTIKKYVSRKTIKRLPNMIIFHRLFLLYMHISLELRKFLGNAQQLRVPFAHHIFRIKYKTLTSPYASRNPQGSVHEPYFHLFVCRQSVTNLTLGDDTTTFNSNSNPQSAIEMLSVHF